MRSRTHLKVVAISGAGIGTWESREFIRTHSKINLFALLYMWSARAFGYFTCFQLPHYCYKWAVLSWSGRLIDKCYWQKPERRNCFHSIALFHITKKQKAQVRTCRLLLRISGCTDLCPWIGRKTPIHICWPHFGRSVQQVTLPLRMLQFDNTASDRTHTSHAEPLMCNLLTKQYLHCYWGLSKWNLLLCSFM